MLGGKKIQLLPHYLHLTSVVSSFEVYKKGVAETMFCNSNAVISV